MHCRLQKTFGVIYTKSFFDFAVPSTTSKNAFIRSLTRLIDVRYCYVPERPTTYEMCTICLVFVLILLIDVT